MSKLKEIFNMIKNSDTNEFRLVANQRGNTELECYIHPAMIDGDTVDFIIKEYAYTAEILPDLDVERVK